MKPVKFKSGDRVVNMCGKVGTVNACWENLVEVELADGEYYHWNPVDVQLTKESDMPKQNIKFVYDDAEQPDIRVKMVKCGTLAPISQNVVEDFVREGIEHLMENKSESCWYAQTGDTLVLVTVDEEDNYEATIATPRSRAYINVPSV
jgi:hypothetical protein